MAGSMRRTAVLSTKRKELTNSYSEETKNGVLLRFNKLVVKTAIQLRESMC